MRDLEKELYEDFSDREYREAYAAGFLNTWISQQLTTVRRQRGLTQDQLAALVGTKQPGIARMERDDYGRWNFATLQKVAFALGCRLKVSLETFGSLIKEAAAFSEPSLERPSFEQDPVFTRHPHDELIPFGSGPLNEMKRKMIPWLLNKGPKEQLADWLQGYDLPATGDEIPPWEWLVKAVIPGPDQLRYGLAGFVKKAIEDRWDINPPGRRKPELVKNLLLLAKGIHNQEILAKSVWQVYLRREDIAFMPIARGDSPIPTHPLVWAALYNQFSAVFEPLWRSYLLQPTALPGDPLDYISTGLLGSARMSPVPNETAIVRGAKTLKDWDLPVSERIRILQLSFERVWADFLAIDPLLPVRVAEWPLCDWSEPILVAWRRSFSALPPQRSGRHMQTEHLLRFAQRSSFAART